MPRHRRSSPITAGLDFWTFGAEASTVVGLRMQKLARGGSAASDEALLMVREKRDVATEVYTAFLNGGLGSTPAAIGRSIFDRYATRVRANHQRLS